MPESLSKIHPADMDAAFLMPLSPILVAHHENVNYRAPTGGGGIGGKGGGGDRSSPAAQQQQSPAAAATPRNSKVVPEVFSMHKGPSEILGGNYDPDEDRPPRPAGILVGEPEGEGEEGEGEDRASTVIHPGSGPNKPGASIKPNLRASANFSPLRNSNNGFPASPPPPPLAPAAGNSPTAPSPRPSPTKSPFKLPTVDEGAAQYRPDDSLTLAAAAASPEERRQLLKMQSEGGRSSKMSAGRKSQQEDEEDEEEVSEVIQGGRFSSGRGALEMGGVRDLTSALGPRIPVAGASRSRIGRGGGGGSEGGGRDLPTSPTSIQKKVAGGGQLGSVAEHRSFTERRSNPIGMRGGGGGGGGISGGAADSRKESKRETLEEDRSLASGQGKNGSKQTGPPRPLSSGGGSPSSPSLTGSPEANLEVLGEHYIVSPSARLHPGPSKKVW